MSGSASAAVIAFAVAAGVITLLAFTAALVVAAAKGRVVAGLPAEAPTIERWGGALLGLVGAWFLATAAFAGPIARLIG